MWWPIVGWGGGEGGWWAHHHDLDDRCLQWPYITPHFPLLTDLFFKEIDIHHCAWDFEQKLRDCFCHDGYRVLKLPELQ